MLGMGALVRLSARITARFAGRGETAAVGLVLAGALVLRLLGVSRGLPYVHEWDEPTVMSYVIRMIQRGDLNPNTFIYPSVYYYLLWPVMYLHYLFLHVQGMLNSPWDIGLFHPQAPPEIYAWYITHPSFYLWGRTLTALLGAATVFLVYRIGKAAYGIPVGLLAAGLLAVSPGAVYYSDTVRVDIPMVFFVTLAVLLGLRVLRGGDRRDYILAGLVAGLAISTKESAFWVMVPLGVAHLLSPRRKYVVDLNVVLMGCCAVVGFIVGTPYILITPQTVLAQMYFEAAAYGAHHTLGVMRWALPMYLSYIVRPSQGHEWYVIPHLTLGLPAAVAAVLGLVRGFRQAPRLHLYMLSFPLPYLLFMASQPVTVLRFMMPVLPFAAIFAAVGTTWAWQQFQAVWPASAKGPWRSVVAGASVVIVIAVPIRDSFALGWTMGHRPDTRSEVVDWLRTHVPPGTPVAVEADLRWFLPALERLPFKILFSPRAAGLGWYSRQGVEYAVVGDRSPLRTLAVAAAFSRRSYIHHGEDLDTYPVIDPPILVVDVGRALPVDRATVFPRRIGPAEMISEPARSPSAGTITGSIRLPSLRVSPGSYTLAITAAWPRPSWLPPLATYHYQIRVIAGDHVVGTFPVDTEGARTYITPPFHVPSAQVLPLRVVGDLRGSVWALRPAKHQCARVSDAPELNPAQFTIEAWILMHTLHRASSVNEERETRILAKNAERGYTLRIDGQQDPRAWTLQLALAGNWSAVIGGPGSGPMGSEGLVPMQEWVHVAATADGHFARTYINGRPIGTSRSGNPTGAYRTHGNRVDGAGAPLLIGCLATYDDWFDGLIADVRVWNYPRSLEEIRNGMSAAPARHTAGLVAAWAFDSVTPGGRIPDVSGHGHDIPNAAEVGRVLKPLTLSVRQAERGALEMPVPTEVVVRRVPGPSP